jgi:hypothetical protein
MEGDNMWSNVPYGQIKAIFPNIHTIPPSALRSLPKSAICVAREILTLISTRFKLHRGLPEAWPSLSYLSRRTNYSVHTVSIAIHALQEAGVIWHKHRRTSLRNTFRSNLYYIGQAITVFVEQIKLRVKNSFSHLKPGSIKVVPGTNIGIDRPRINQILDRITRGIARGPTRPDARAVFLDQRAKLLTERP